MERIIHECYFLLYANISWIVVHVPVYLDVVLIFSSVFVFRGVQGLSALPTRSVRSIRVRTPVKRVSVLFSDI